MLELFYPDEYLDSPYEMDFAAYRQRGYRGVLFDIDNTLVPHGAPATKEAIALFAELRGLGFETVLLSNNDEDRVAPFARAVGSPYLCEGGKPGKKGYQEAMRLAGTTQETTLFVGDQIFTDVLGARRCKIHAVLVKPIDKREEIQIVLKRFPERLVLYLYGRAREKCESPSKKS